MAPTLIASYQVDSAASDTSSLVSPSFTPSNGEVLVVKAGTEENVCTIGAASGGSQTFTSQATVTTGANLGAAAIITATVAGSPGSMTVTLAFAGSGKWHSMTVERWSNAQLAATPATNNGGTKSGTASAPSATVTTVANNSIVSNVNTDWNANAPAGRTYRSSATEEGIHDKSTSFYVAYFFYQSAASSGAQTIGLTAPSSQNWSLLGIEIQDAGGAAAVPYNPQRTVQARDPGEGYWTQRDRRDANLVATAADPLVAPLDSAWQAGGRHWHLYNDVPAYREPAYGQQRPYVSDPSLLAAPALGSPLLGAAETAKRLQPAAYADRREVPQQPPRESDPAMLATALLEDPLLSGSELEKRTNTPATHADRRRYPQQPSRLADQSSAPAGTPLDPLLAGWPTRTLAYLTPALLVDRREVPQQRTAAAAPDDVVIVGAGATGGWWGVDDTAAYIGQRRPTDPSLLDAPGAPADPTLAGALVRWLAGNLPATHADRRLVPQQPPRLFDQSSPSSPLDPTLTGWPARALFADRREMPAQRLYISDPSTYPQASSDPLTVAWGAGGHYWLVYNGAAWIEPLRAGQQPPRLPVPDQPVGGDDPLGFASGVGGDLWRRANLPAYLDRREVPQQPPRRTLYFDAGPGVPPLTLAWGAGGALWHLYQWRRTARSWWPSRPTFTSLDAVCDHLTHRPNTGTTARPSAGLTSRPNTGTTPRPHSCQ